MRQLAVLMAAVLAAAAVACGDPAELPEDGAVALALARDRVLAALATEQRLEESSETANRLVARVRKVVSSGALEAKQLDEFGLAALGELRLSAPSLVIVDAREIPRALDRRALTAFLADARSDPPAATRPAAAAEVARIERVIADADAGPDTDVPGTDMTVDVYLGDLAARTRPVWPDLAADLTTLRSEL